MVRIIAELGSCHMGKIERIYEAIDKCKKYGFELKLQLFPNEAPYVPTNIHLEFNDFVRARVYAEQKVVALSASVFDYQCFQFLASYRNEKIPFIKFSYSNKQKKDWIEQTIRSGKEAIVSCDVMTDHLVPKGATKLYCIPEYPVRYDVNFDELFPRFDGFSDHTLGIKQTKKAIKAGAKIIEKHVRLGYEDETCPDARFAVTFEELAKLRHK